MTKLYTDVVVIGGGFAGLAAAAALSRDNVDVTVLETTAAPVAAFREELVHPPGVRMLAALGFDQDLFNAGAVRLEGFAAFERADAPAIGLPYATGPGMAVDHELIVNTFRRELRRRSSVHFMTRSPANELVIENGRVVGVRCAGGYEYRSKIMVVADGRHSKLRKRLGISATTELLSYMVTVALKEAVVPASDRGNVFLGAPGPILAYPYAPNRVRVCIDVPRTVSRGRDGIATYVCDHYATFLPEPMRRALVAAIRRGDFQICANHATYTEACAVMGAAVVGDAGGSSHPFAAIGMTCSLHDAMTLAEAVKEFGTTDDALIAYQRRRYRFIRGREIFAHAIYEVLGSNGAGPRALRDGILGYWRANDRTRIAPMGILAGDKSRVGAFIAEYARVMTTSGWQLVKSTVRSGDRLRNAAQPLTGLLKTAGACAAFAWNKGLSALALERTTALAPVLASVARLHRSRAPVESDAA